MGTIDPAAVTFLMNKENLSTDEMDCIMNKKSGVLGVSGVSSDFRDLDKAVAEGNERAELALQIFLYQVEKVYRCLCLCHGGLDAVVFTAGIGGNNPDIRQRYAQTWNFWVSALILKRIIPGELRSISVQMTQKYAH